MRQAAGECCFMLYRAVFFLKSRIKPTGIAARISYTEILNILLEHGAPYYLLNSAELPSMACPTTSTRLSYMSIIVCDIVEPDFISAVILNRIRISVPFRPSG